MSERQNIEMRMNNVAITVEYEECLSSVWTTPPVSLLGKACRIGGRILRIAVKFAHPARSETCL